MIAALIAGWIITVVITAWVTHFLCQVDLPVDTPVDVLDSDDFLEDYDLESPGAWDAAETKEPAP